MKYHYDAKLVRVIDGDTVVLNCDMGQDIWHVDKFRLYGINAPKLSGEEKERGIASAKFLLELIGGVGMMVEAETLKDKREKYGRYLVKLSIGATNINAEMVKCGFAEEYKP